MHKDEANKMLYEAKTLEELKTAVNAGADVNSFEFDSPVVTKFINCNYASVEMLEFLLKSGANVNTEYDFFDSTTTPFLSLFESSCHRFSELEKEKIKLMTRYGVDLDKRFVCNDYEDRYSHNALECAVMCKDLDVVKILVEAGADVNKVDYNLLEWCKDKSIREYIENCRKSKVILENKETHRKNELKRKRREKKIGGVVVADIIAQKVIEGEENRVITPAVGKELQQAIMRERYGKKGER